MREQVEHVHQNDVHHETAYGTTTIYLSDDERDRYSASRFVKDTGRRWRHVLADGRRTRACFLTEAAARRWAPAGATVEEAS